MAARKFRIIILLLLTVVIVASLEFAKFDYQQNAEVSVSSSALRDRYISATVDNLRSKRAIPYNKGYNREAAERIAREKNKRKLRARRIKRSQTRVSSIKKKRLRRSNEFAGKQIPNADHKQMEADQKQIHKRKSNEKQHGKLKKNKEKELSPKEKEEKKLKKEKAEIRRKRRAVQFRSADVQNLTNITLTRRRRSVSNNGENNTTDNGSSKTLESQSSNFSQSREISLPDANNKSKKEINFTDNKNNGINQSKSNFSGLVGNKKNETNDSKSKSYSYRNLPIYKEFEEYSNRMEKLNNISEHDMTKELLEFPANYDLNKGSKMYSVYRKDDDKPDRQQSKASRKKFVEWDSNQEFLEKTKNSMRRPKIDDQELTDKRNGSRAGFPRKFGDGEETGRIRRLKASNEFNDKDVAGKEKERIRRSELMMDRRNDSRMGFPRKFGDGQKPGRIRRSKPFSDPDDSVRVKGKWRMNRSQYDSIFDDRSAQRNRNPFSYDAERKMNIRSRTRRSRDMATAGTDIMERRSDVARYDDMETAASKKSSKKKKKKKWKKGGGHKYKADHFKKKGHKDEKGYKKKKHFDKGEKGKHGKDKHEGHYKEKKGHKKKKHEEAKKYGEKHEAKKGHKGEKYGEKAGHKKGHKTKGYHNKFHKDEYHKEHKFYDDFHKKGHHKKHGHHHKHHEEKEGKHKKGKHHKSAFHHDKKGKKGKSEKGHYDKEEKGHKSKKGKEKHHSHKEKYGKKGGHKEDKKYGFKKGHH